MPEKLIKKSNFVHLHTHSHFSMLDGMGKIPDLVKRAVELGMPALALTDHGVMHGAVEFFEECQKAGIKPIIGCEVYVAPRTLRDKVPRVDATPYHLILLARNEAGYKNLMKLTSVAHLEGFYYKPRVDKELLRKHSEGLIACSACVKGEAPYKALEDMEKGREVVREMLEIFGEGNVYLEVQTHATVENQEASNAAIFQLADEFNLKVVATNDIHYINADDAEAQDALICLQTSRYMNENNRLTMMGDDYSMLSEETILANFPDHPEVASNTLEVAEKCNFDMELGKFKFPEFPLPEGETYESYLRKLIDERLPTVVDKITPEMRERIDYEFKVIKDKGYLGYFLIVQDFFHFAKSRGIPTNTRGSAAGCFISYALGITAKQLNPLEYNLPFERFLNPLRPSAPDIDADIADSGRDEIIKYVSAKYGKNHVAQIITFGTMAARMAIRDVGRVLSMNYSEVDAIAKLIPFGQKLEQAVENVEELKILYNSDPRIKRCIDIAKRLEGVVRHASVHAAGVVIAPGEITDYTPVMRDTKGDRLITQYEMNAVGEDGVGLIKMDFLGLANLSIVQNVIKIIRKTRNIEVILDEIPLDDKKTFQLLSKGETIGVFQLESEGMRKNIKELRPTSIHDIMAMVALYRPGPMAFIPEYVARKHNPARIKYDDPRLKNILEKSLGLIVYQDDVLMIAIELAGYDWQEVDKFRKAIGKKIVKEMAAQKEKFFKQIIERGMKKAVAEDLWTQIETFAGYGFNKAHAASYGLLAYQTAYLKTNYPPEYMSALMTSNKDDLDKLAMEIDDCKRMKIDVLPPSVNESFVDFGVVRDSGNIRFGLSAIKNVGLAVAEQIVEERKTGDQYGDIENFLSRLGPKVINKKSLEAMIMAGALDDLGERAEMIYNMEKMLAFANIIQKNKDSGQNSLFGEDSEIKAAKIEFEATAPAEKKQRLTWERELLGMYVSEHPLSGALHIIEPYRTIKLNEINESMEGEFVRVSGIFTSIQNIMTRQNQKMGFARLEDLAGNVEVLAFPKLLSELSELFLPDKIVAVDGFLNFKDGTPKLLAEAVYELGEKRIIPEFQKRGKRKAWGGAGGNKSEIRNPPTSLSELRGTGKSETNSKFQNSNQIKKLEPADIKPMSLIITVEKGSDKSIFNDLKTLFSEFPGNSQVIINVPNNGHGMRQIKTRSRVDICPLLKVKLKEIVGAKNIEMR